MRSNQNKLLKEIGLLKLTVSWRIVSEKKGLFFSRMDRGGVSGDGRGRPAFFIMLHNMRE